MLKYRRNVDDPCTTCGGWGVCAYSSTATWRGGMGGQAFTSDVCDQCWGSGDKYSPGVNLREFTRARAAWDEEQCLQYFANRVGANISTMRSYFTPIADAIAALGNKRKIPVGFEEFWWRSAMHAISSTLRRFAQEDK